MSRVALVAICLILLALATPGQTIRQEATTQLAIEWQWQPAHCLEALRYLALENNPVRALRELERDQSPHFRQVYEQASKFDDFWELVASPEKAPDSITPTAPDTACANASGQIGSLYIAAIPPPGIPMAGIPTLYKVRGLYGQKLYLAALFELLRSIQAVLPPGPLPPAPPPPPPPGPFRVYEEQLMNYRVCYAVKTSATGAPRLFDAVEERLGK